MAQNRVVVVGSINMDLVARSTRMPAPGETVLGESFATTPGPSVSGLYFGHPQARYFSVGRIGRDQVADYADRKGITLAEAERCFGRALDCAREQRTRTAMLRTEASLERLRRQQDPVI